MVSRNLFDFLRFRQFYQFQTISVSSLYGTNRAQYCQSKQGYVKAWDASPLPSKWIRSYCTSAKFLHCRQVRLFSAVCMYRSRVFATERQLCNMCNFPVILQLEKVLATNNSRMLPHRSCFQSYSLKPPLKVRKMNSSKRSIGRRRRQRRNHLGRG